MFVLNTLLASGKHQIPRGEEKGVWLRRSSRGKAGQANHPKKSAAKNCCSWLGFFFFFFSPVPPHSFLSPISAPAGSLKGGGRPSGLCSHPRGSPGAGDRDPAGTAGDRGQRALGR